MVAAALFPMAALVFIFTIVDFFPCCRTDGLDYPGRSLLRLSTATEQRTCRSFNQRTIVHCQRRTAGQQHYIMAKLALFIRCPSNTD